MRTSLASILFAALCACASHDVTAPTEVPDATPTPPIADAMTPTFDGQAHSALTVTRTDLASNGPGAQHTIPTLQNAWGIAFDPDARGLSIWVIANGSDSALVFGAEGAVRSSAIAVPGGPSGEVFTGSKDLDGDKLVFATEAGTILGWQPTDRGAAVVRVDDSASGAIYKGLAIINQDPMRLAATDFHNGKIDVYGPGYEEIEAEGLFLDKTIPAGFAPFGIASFGGDVYVSYAKQDADAHDDVKGPGNGFIDVFSIDGRFLRRLVDHRHLNSPWGFAFAPAAFGKLAGALLVGNFGDGTIQAFDPETGNWLGQLADVNAQPIAIDGLWSIVVGPKTDALDLSDRIFFTAGPGDEANGLFGTLAPLP